MPKLSKAYAQTVEGILPSFETPSWICQESLFSGASRPKFVTAKTSVVGMTACV